MKEKVWKLYKEYEEVVNYLIVGGMTTLVSWGTYFACVCTFLNAESAIELQIANILSWIVAVAFARRPY